MGLDFVNQIRGCWQLGVIARLELGPRPLAGSAGSIGGSRPGRARSLVDWSANALNEARLQERRASIAWAIKTAALAAMSTTSSQVITLTSVLGVERAHPCTVKSKQSKLLISAFG